MNQARPISRASTKIRAKMVCSKLPAELVGVAIVIGGPAGMAGSGAAAGVPASGAYATGTEAVLAAASGALALIEAAASGAGVAAGAAWAIQHAAASGSSTVEINRPGFIYSVSDAFGRRDDIGQADTELV